MSVRPEIPYLGTPAQRLTQRINDLTRQLSLLKVNNPGRVTRGSATATFTAASQATPLTITIAAPSTSGHVCGVASSGLVGLTPTQCTVDDNNNGTVTIRCFTITLTNVTGSTTVFYEVWPA